MTLKDLFFFLKDGIHFVIDLKGTNYGHVGHRIKGESIEDVNFAGAPLDQFLVESIEPEFDSDGAFLRIEVKEKDGNSLSIKQWLQGNVIR